MKSLKRLDIDPLAVYGTLCVKCPVSDPSLADPACIARVRRGARDRPAARSSSSWARTRSPSLNDLDVPLARPRRAEPGRDPAAHAVDRRALRAEHRRGARRGGRQARVLVGLQGARRVVRGPAALLGASSAPRSPTSSSPGSCRAQRGRRRRSSRARSALRSSWPSWRGWPRWPTAPLALRARLRRRRCSSPRSTPPTRRGGDAVRGAARGRRDRCSRSARRAGARRRAAGPRGRDRHRAGARRRPAGALDAGDGEPGDALTLELPDWGSGLRGRPPRRADASSSASSPPTRGASACAARDRGRHVRRRCWPPSLRGPARLAAAGAPAHGGRLPGANLDRLGACSRVPHEG